MTLRVPSIFVALVISCLTIRPAGAADAEAAKAFISDLGEQTVSILQQPELSLDEATAKFRDLFADNFDIPTISRFVLGRYWRTASTQQKREFLNLFQALIVDTYARRFSEYSGQGFRIDGSRALSERDSMVSTRITNTSGGTIASIDWRVRERDGRQQIIDVVVEQISMGVTQRSDFDAVIQRGGGNIDALLDALRSQIETAQNRS